MKFHDKKLSRFFGATGKTNFGLWDNLGGEWGNIFHRYKKGALKMRAPLLNFH